MTTKRITPGEELPSNLVRNLGLAKQRKGDVPSNLVDALEREEQAARVDVGLSSAINSELNPTAMAAERAEKVKRLKALVQEGKYHPSSEEVAGALNEEIIFDILTAGAGSGSTGS